MGEGDVEILVLMALRSMEAKRREAHIYPPHVLLIAILKELSAAGVPPPETTKAVAGLVAAGRLKAGRTINDFYLEEL
jgi:hypothetical protein